MAVVAHGHDTALSCSSALTSWPRSHPFLLVHVRPLYRSIAGNGIIGVGVVSEKLERRKDEVVYA
jgi:hypothetical protein